MKKIIILLFIYFLIFPYTNKVFSYGIDFDWSNFYTSIADKASELDAKLYTLELPSEEWTAKKIEKILWKNCLNWNLSESEVRKIASWESGILLKKINNNCKWEDWKISQNLFIELTNAVSDLHEDTRVTSINKSNKIQDISKVWIYADGIDENSPFDLVTDLELIDEIIFEKTEEYDFEWDSNVDLSKELEKELERKIKNDKIKQDLNISDIDITLCEIDWSCNNRTELEVFLCEKLWNCPQNRWDFFDNMESENICKKNESWLTRVSSTILERSILERIKEENFTGNILDWLLEWIWENNSNNNQNSKPTPNSNYKKLNDNKQFPCNNFFCIDVSFETYNHNLLWWWEKTYPSIEFLVKRSNKHLKKFVNSSLVQAKMTINNFELGLKDIKLYEMFHMSIFIAKKPVPILDLNKDFKNSKDIEWWEDEAIYNFKNQLKEYYKSAWLNYDRQNDLSLFTDIEAERISAEKSGYLSPGIFSKHLDKYYEQKAEKSDKIKKFEKTIEEDARNSIISDFELQFKEIEVFSKSINDYIDDMDAILDGMLEIPVDTWVI